MEGILAGAAAGVAVQQLWEIIKRAAACNRVFKKQYKRLGRALERLGPMLDKLPADWQLDALCCEIKRGGELISECAQVPCWKIGEGVNYSRRLEELEEAIQGFIQTASLRGVMALSSRMKEVNSKLGMLLGGGEIVEIRTLAALPPLPVKVFGIQKPVIELKGLLRRHQVVGVCGMGGFGKTTLVNVLCRDPEIQGLFGQNIFFFTVSRSRDTLDILKDIWSQLLVEAVPKFRDVEDAVRQVAHGLSKQQTKYSGDGLIVLDDVWSEKDLKDLLFRTERLKTIFTSREMIRINREDEIYSLSKLEEKAAKELLYHAAGNPSAVYAGTAKQIIERCDGLPLALELIGGRLNGQPMERWEDIKADLLNRGDIYRSQERLLSCLSTTIDFLDEPLRECFLDMGSFPEDVRLPAASVMDTWIELYGLTEKKAFLRLFDLSEKHLLNLTWRTRSHTINGGNYHDLMVSQHDLLRDLALHFWTLKDSSKRKRLAMNGKKCRESRSWNHQEIEAPDDQGRREAEGWQGPWPPLIFFFTWIICFFKNLFWLLHKSFWPYPSHFPFADFVPADDAELVSLQGCEANYSKWSDVNFRNAKVMMVNLSAETYQLPPFLGSMENLRALIIANRSLDRAKLSVLDMGRSSFRNLRRMRLEKISIPGLFEKIEAPFLEKLSLFFCEFSQSSSDSAPKNISILPELKELEIHYATDLVHLPPAVCEMRKLQKLSVTKCPDLKSLPQWMNQLTHLKYLNLYACSSLEGLPDSICELKNLWLLDLCDCSTLEGLPENLGSLTSLAKIDMRRCSNINELPKSVMQMGALELVICDEETMHLWDPVKHKAALTRLKVYVPKEETNLSFLH